jgi:NAD(P)-dependent dehydrogenase (short-subunit alcohol dehydrogenase family)
MLASVDTATMLGRVWLGGIGHPEEVAAAVRFLASGQARYITSHMLRADGGFAG